MIHTLNWGSINGTPQKRIGALCIEREKSYRYWWSTCCYRDLSPPTCLRSKQHMWIPYNYRVV